MHKNTWAGIDLKRAHAEFFLKEMSRVLQPDRSHMAAVQQSHRIFSGSDWQRAFYAYVDAFLVMTRSIPAIIHHSFGKDPIFNRDPFKAWFAALSPDERDRREQFQTEFDLSHKAFRRHFLSEERNRSFHRKGYPAVQIKITGIYGIEHIGDPLKAVPSVESRPPEEIGNDPEKMFGATQSGFPIEPMWPDFTIDGKPLFDECRSYLNLADELVTRAREIAQRVHDDKPLNDYPALEGGR